MATSMERYHIILQEAVTQSAECHHSSVQVHLQTQAHLLLIQARQYEVVCLYISMFPS